jgi:hypothetical protein
MVVVLGTLGAAAAWAAPVQKKAPVAKKGDVAKKTPVQKKTPPKPVLPPSEAAGTLLKPFLAGPMAGVDEIVFAVRVSGRDHWYVNFGNYADDSPNFRERAFKFEEGVYWGYGEGGRLCRLNLRTKQLKVLLDDPQGGVRDPQVSYDGQKILFAYRRGGEHPYHLYEINIDGSSLRQLTDGPDDDIEPTYCPDGSIVFCSSRCRRFVNCWHSRVATLYRCDANGQDIRLLSSNNDHDNTPWVLPDGRILYMRWEYVDRSQVHYHHLWTMNPNGTSQTVYYGNLHPGIAMLDAKPIPGTDKVVASFSPGHGKHEHMGYVTVVDPARGPDAVESARQITKVSEWRDPWAFSEDCFLVAHKQGIFVMDGEGRTDLVYQLPESDKAMDCHEPRPLVGRVREPIIGAHVDTSQATGKLVLEDFYAGRKTQGLKRGTVKKLLVLKQLPKPVNFSGGMQPLTIGGSFTLAEILGTVPVEADGSAHMEVPALQSLFFVALDENDLAVKRMHSFLTVQPGETLSCVGCHEERTAAPHPVSGGLMAMKRRASAIEPIAGVPAVIDFPRDVQPILDRRCVECHSPDRYEGRVELTGDKTREYTISYLTLQTRGLVSDNRNRPESNFEPYTIGSSASRLMKLIDGSHYGVKLTERERTIIRLWIDTSATYPGTYAALGCGSYPVAISGMGRCTVCHVRDSVDRRGKPIKIIQFGKFLPREYEPVCNLSHPEKSRVLRAPLAKEAGGLGICSKIVFANTQDPLYQKTLAALQAAHDRLMEGKRFDMPGFRPNKDYIREMQRFGFLPKTLGADEPVDPYAVDRAYWDSFLHRPKLATLEREP